MLFSCNKSLETSLKRWFLQTCLTVQCFNIFEHYFLMSYNEQVRLSIWVCPFQVVCLVNYLLSLHFVYAYLHLLVPLSPLIEINLNILFNDCLVVVSNTYVT